MKASKERMDSQIALVMRTFAVKTLSGIQVFHENEIVRVPKERMGELEGLGLICTLWFTPEHGQVITVNSAQVH